MVGLGEWFFHWNSTCKGTRIRSSLVFIYKWWGFNLSSPLLPVLSPFGNLLGYLSSASRVGGRLQTLLAMGWGDVWVMSMDLLTLPTSCLEARSNRPVDKEIQISFYHFSDLFFFSWKNKLDSISFPIWYKTLFWKMTNTASVYVNFGSLKSKLGLPCSPCLGTTGLSPFWQGQGLRWL